jgi:hypothetical protein
MAFLCLSQQGEFKNTIKNFLGEIHVKNFWPKKLIFFLFPPFRLYPAPLCVSQQGEFKNTTKHFLGEIHVKNFKKLFLSHNLMSADLPVFGAEMRIIPIRDSFSDQQRCIKTARLSRSAVLSPKS